MTAMNAPVYEVNPESGFYKAHAQKRANISKVNKILGDIENYLGIPEETFIYYDAARFGFFGSSDEYKMYKEMLKKNPDSNGVYLFKKTTPEFKYVTELMKQVDELRNVVSPFSAHDIFGMNNIKASQWVGDRMFVSVVDGEYTNEYVNERKAANEVGEVEVANAGGTYFKRVETFKVEPVMDVSYVEYLKLVTAQLEEIEKKEAK